MTKKIGSILLIFTFIISLVGCEKKIETGSISGFDENEEYISMWVHTIENTPEGEAYKKSVELFNKKRGLKNQPSSLLTVNSYFLFLVRTRVAPAAAARTKVPTAMPAAPVTGLLLPSPLLVLSS